MTVLFVAEHWDPLLGGATHLTKTIVKEIANEIDLVYLLVPNSNSNSVEASVWERGIHLIKLPVLVDIRDRKHFRGAKRRNFAKSVDSYLKSNLDVMAPCIIHIMTGMYLLRWLDISYYQEKGIKCIANILNVPPEESGKSWKGDNFILYYRDRIRLLLVKWVNRRRIRYHDFDAYTAISDHAGKLLSAIVTGPIKVIPLGGDSDLLHNRKNSGIDSKAGRSIGILTAGGINPSKNQELIPKIASLLQQNNLKFTWHVIGPIRNQRYADFVKRLIKEYDLCSNVYLIPGMPKGELMEYYQKADLYVQPSKEEGFCMTALDAILSGLPVVGSDTGAIAELIQDGCGELTELSANAYYLSICRILDQFENYKYDRTQLKRISEKYTWRNNTARHIELYNSLVN